MSDPVVTDFAPQTSTLSTTDTNSVTNPVMTPSIKRAVTPTIAAPPVILVGKHELLANTANQKIQIFVAGGTAVQATNVEVQIADGGPAGRRKGERPGDHQRRHHHRHHLRVEQYLATRRRKPRAADLRGRHDHCPWHR